MSKNLIEIRAKVSPRVYQKLNQEWSNQLPKEKKSRSVIAGEIIISHYGK